MWLRWTRRSAAALSGKALGAPLTTSVIPRKFIHPGREAMEISPLFTSDNWEGLNLAPDSSVANWEYAVQIFDDRYRSRYLNPIDALRKHENRDIFIYSGFVIMAIDCLLIETLCQFHYGVESSDILKQDNTYGHINNNQDVFVDFFNRSTEFHGFTEDISGTFYTQIRCGILHQAESKKTSTIHINHAKQNVLVANNGNGISVRRDLFTDSLIVEYENYKNSLLANPPNTILRNNFINKMSLICNENN